MNIGKPTIPPKFEDSKDRLTYILAEYKLGVYFAIGSATILFATGRIGIPELPQWLVNWLIVGAIGIVPSMVLSKIFIVDRFIDDPRVKVLEIRPDEMNNVTLYRPHSVPRDLWENRKHIEGMPIQEPEGFPDAVVTKFEYDEAVGQLEVRGLNPEIADPAELAATNGKLEAVFGDLLQDKREHQYLKSTLSLRKQRMEEQVVNGIVGAVEKGRSFDPENLNILEEEEIPEVSRETDAVRQIQTNGDIPNSNSNSNNDEKQ